jgi:serine/threonine protein kinase
MSRTGALDTIVDPEFYESIDYYKPKEDELIDVVKQMLPGDWEFARNTVWYGCQPPEEKDKPLPTQGWKIHISSSVSNAQDILRAVVPILVRQNICFKFALDINILTFLNSKQWSRQGAGKFITIYPYYEEQFKELIEELHQATRAFEGLYILSDRRYKDSKVVFYRYGGIRPAQFLNVRGVKTSMLSSPQGEQVQDQRRPYFVVPEWTQDPFESTPSNVNREQVAADGILLKDGRYRVKSVLGFSNSGGVYIGEDKQTGEEVVIKESRPFVSSTKDSMALLKKEHRILSKIGPTKVGPQALDFFQDWENCFLVQEYLKGPSLASFSTRNNITLYTHPTLEQAEQFYKNFKTIFLQLTNLVKVMHDNGIVLSDLSPNNVIVLPETMEIKLIDFEGAYEVGVDQPIFIYTPGFAYADQMAGAASNFESDYFSLGASMHHFLMPVNQIFLINPRARYAFMESVTADIGFPRSIYELISSLIDKVAENRYKPAEVIEILQRDEPVRMPSFRTNGPEADPIYRDDIQRIAEYILAVANYERKDRLFPADSAIFGTNPMSIAHGACGVACALKRMIQTVPEAVTDWILARNRNRELYPPNLYLGLAGIAWGMLELGLHEPAQQVLESSWDHSLLHEAFDVYCGIAGWGMSNLRFFMEFQDEKYLQKAKEAANHLLKIRTEDEQGCHWKDKDQIPLGYAHGASGVAVFLLYLYLASGENIFLDVGVKALDFDLNNSVPNLEDGLSWKASTTSGRIMYPYWRYGSAGVGTAVVRYYRLLGEERYKEMLEKIFLETNRKYSVFPGMQMGLTGLGEFLMDLHWFTNEPRYLEGAYRVATGLSLFKIERKEGLAFPGDSLQRISCDYMTGSAGVGHFLHRLVSKEAGTFQLDQLFATSGHASQSFPGRGGVLSEDQQSISQPGLAKELSESLVAV